MLAADTGRQVLVDPLVQPPSIESVLLRSDRFSDRFAEHLAASDLGHRDGFLKISNAQPNAFPWELDAIRIVFSEDVDVRQDDLIVSGVTQTELLPTEFSYDIENFAATWTVPRVVKDRLQLNLSNHIQSKTSGRFVDADPLGGASDSDPFVFNFSTLAGDLNGDGFVTVSDLNPVRNNFLAAIGNANYNVYHDANADGFISISDLNPVRDHFLNSRPNGLPIDPTQSESAGISRLPTQSMYEDGPQQTIYFAVNSSAGLAPGQTALQFTIDSSNESLIDATRASITQVANHYALQFPSRTNQFGEAQLTIGVTDAAGTTFTSFDVEVNSVNDRPFVASPPSPFDLTEDFPRATVDLRDVFSDIDSSNLRYQIMGDGQTLVDARINATILEIDLVAGRYGSAQIVVQAEDDLGETASTTIVVNVVGENRVLAILDDRDPEFQTTGDWADGFGASYNSLSMSALATDTDDTYATWRATDLVPGRYRVSTTYQASPFLLQQARYSVLDASNMLLIGQQTVDQTQSPTDLLDQNNADWRDVAEVNLLGRELLVQLHATGESGVVLADAIRVERIGDAIPNSGPTNLSLSTASVPENQPIGTLVGVLTATDTDAFEAHEYRLVQGAGSADNEHFAIDGDRLVTNAEFNFEVKSNYQIRVQVTDAFGEVFEKEFSVVVTNVAEAPTNFTLSSSSFPESRFSGTTIGSFSAFAEDSLHTSTSLFYEFVDGEGAEDNKLFRISFSGTLSPRGAIDYEARNRYSIRVRVYQSRNQSLGLEDVFILNVTDVNESPSDPILSANRIPENMPAGSVVGSLTSDDPDLNDQIDFFFEASDGVRSKVKGDYEIVGNNIVTRKDLDYEFGNRFASIRVLAVDRDGLESYPLSTYIDVDDVPEAPYDIKLFGGDVAENLPAPANVGFLVALDDDISPSYRFELVDGAGSDSNAFFTIVGNEIQSTTVFNYEVASQHSIRISATEPTGGTIEKVFLITVANENEWPTNLMISNTVIPADHDPEIEVATLSAEDEDADETFRFSTSHSSDIFFISGNKLFIYPNYVPVSKFLRLNLSVRDSAGKSHIRSFDILDERYVDPTSFAPANKPPTSIAISHSKVAENLPAGTLVGRLSANDPEGTLVTYALSDTAPPDYAQAQFEIVGNELRTAAVLDFEQTFGSRRVEIVATDAEGLTTSRTLFINVVDSNESPTAIELSTQTVRENFPVGFSFAILTADDPDGIDRHSFSLVAGDGDTHNEDFAIVDGQSLQLARPIDFEAAENRSIRVRATDSKGAFVEQTLPITVVDVYEAPAPIFISMNNTTLAENSPPGTVVGNLEWNAPDASARLIVTDAFGSEESATFEIVGDQLISKRSFDYETIGERFAFVTVRAVSGSGTVLGSASYLIEVTDVAEELDPDDSPAPFVLPSNAIGLDRRVIAENLPAGAVVGRLTYDGGRPFASFELQAGPGDDDNDDFEIVGNELRTKRSFDFESTDSTLFIRVAAKDRSGIVQAAKALAINVSNVNEAPTQLLLTKSSIAEGSQNGWIGGLRSNDPDSGDSYESGAVYQFIAGEGATDNEFFEIRDLLYLYARTPFDFETQNLYSIRLRRTDQHGLAFEQSFTITVTDVNESPTSITLSNADIAPDQSVGSVVADFLIDDPDQGETYTVTLDSGESGRGQNSLFSIVNNQLIWQGGQVPDNPHVYIVVRFESSLGGSTTSVFDLNDGRFYDPQLRNRPPYSVQFSDINGSGTIEENLPAGSLVGTLTASDPNPEDTFSFSLLPPSDENENSKFELVGNELRTKEAFNYEDLYDVVSYANIKVDVRATDDGGLTLDRSINVRVLDVNEAPTDLQWSISEISENQSFISGSFTVEDPDRRDWHEFSLVEGEGSEDNHAFEIVGLGSLKPRQTISYEDGATRSVRVRVTDRAGNYFEKPFTIQILDVSEPPAITLPTDIALDEGTVSHFEFSITDPDGGAVVHQWNALPDFASIVDLGDGNFRLEFAPDFQDQGYYAWLLSATDTDELETSRLILIVIENNNRLPTAVVPETLTSSEDATNTWHLTASDPDGGYPVFSTTNLPQFAQLIDAGNGKATILIAPGLDDVGTYPIEITVTDSSGGTNVYATQIEVVEWAGPPSRTGGQLVAGTPGVTYWRGDDGEVQRSVNGNWTVIQEFVSHADGIYWLSQDGILWLNEVSLGYDRVQSFVVQPDGSLFVERTDNVLVRRNGVWSELEGFHRGADGNVTVYWERTGPTQVLLYNASNVNLATFGEGSLRGKAYAIEADSEGSLYIYQTEFRDGDWDGFRFSDYDPSTPLSFSNSLSKKTFDFATKVASGDVVWYDALTNQVFLNSTVISDHPELFAFGKDSAYYFANSKDQTYRLFDGEIEEISKFRLSTISGDVYWQSLAGNLYRDSTPQAFILIDKFELSTRLRPDGSTEEILFYRTTDGNSLRLVNGVAYTDVREFASYRASYPPAPVYWLSRGDALWEGLARRRENVERFAVYHGLLSEFSKLTDLEVFVTQKNGEAFQELSSNWFSIRKYEQISNGHILYVDARGAQSAGGGIDGAFPVPDDAVDFVSTERGLYFLRPDGSVQFGKGDGSFVTELTGVKSIVGHQNELYAQQSDGQFVRHLGGVNNFVLATGVSFVHDQVFYILGTMGIDIVTATSASVPVGVQKINFYGFDGDDRFTNNTSLPSYANGGRHNDMLIGGSGSDYFEGGDGNDTLIGNAGVDLLVGGNGEDTIDGGAGVDFSPFGALDTIRYENGLPESGFNLLGRSSNGFGLSSYGGSGGSCGLGLQDCTELPATVEDDNYDPFPGLDDIDLSELQVSPGADIATDITGAFLTGLAEALSTTVDQIGGYRVDFNPRLIATAAGSADDRVFHHTDIDQGTGPTCSFLAALAGVATTDFDFNSHVQYVKHEGGGVYQYRVKLYSPILDANRNVTGVRAGSWETVKFSFGGADGHRAEDPRLGDQNELWTLLYQRAYLQRFGVRNASNDLTDGDYQLVSFPTAAITGNIPSLSSVAGERSVAIKILNALSAGAMVVVGSPKVTTKPGEHFSVDSNGIVSIHAYTILDIRITNFLTMQGTVTLQNPWGQEEYGTSPTHEIVKTLSISAFYASFSKTGGNNLVIGHV